MICLQSLYTVRTTDHYLEETLRQCLGIALSVNSRGELDVVRQDRRTP